MGSRELPPLSDIPQEGYRRFALLEGPLRPLMRGRYRRFARQEAPGKPDFLNLLPFFMRGLTGL